MERLKKKVIASLQQATTGSFQQPEVTDNKTGNREDGSTEFQQNHNQTTGSSPSSSSTSASSSSASGGSSSVVASRLLANADATAHLTEREREILLQVYKKEEQFQLDTMKQLSSQRAAAPKTEEPTTGRSAEQPPARRRPLDRQLSVATGSSGCISSNSRQSPPPPTTSFALGPVRSAGWFSGQRPASASSGSYQLQSSSSNAAADRSPANSNRNRRPASSLGAASSSAADTSGSLDPPATPLVGQCRICRKSILANETCHLCSACNQFVCEDCGSYSAANQHWMCSSCRRRATKPAIPADALKELGLNQNSSAVRRMTLRLNQVELRSVLAEAVSSSAACDEEIPKTLSDSSKTPPASRPKANNNNVKKQISGSRATKCDTTTDKSIVHRPSQQKAQVNAKTEQQPEMSSSQASRKSSFASGAKVQSVDAAGSRLQDVVTPQPEVASERRLSSLKPAVASQLQLRRLSDQSSRMAAGCRAVAQQEQGKQQPMAGSGQQRSAQYQFGLHRGFSETDHFTSGHMASNKEGASFSLATNQQQLDNGLSGSRLQINDWALANQRRHSDHWTGPLVQGPLQPEVKRQTGYSNFEYRSNQQQPPHISSIVTSYSRKRRATRRQSSDYDQQQFSSSSQDSSSDSPPEFAITGSCDNSIPVPSVMVSEFRGSNHRLEEQRNSQVQMNIPQAPIGQQVNHQLIGGQPDPYVRRGSGGRLLPKIPGEQQSRSLLDLDSSGQLEQQQLPVDGLRLLHLPNSGQNVRRASAPEEFQNLKLDATINQFPMDMIPPCNLTAQRSPSAAYFRGPRGELLERLILHRDANLDLGTTNMAAAGFGLQVMGGKMEEPAPEVDCNIELRACVSWVLPNGPAHRVGLRRGDVILEWDGKSLINLSYEQVAEVVESSANFAELLIIRAQHRGSSYQRRMSSQPPLTSADQLNLSSFNVNRRPSALAADGARAGTGRRLPQIPLAAQQQSAEIVNQLRPDQFVQQHQQQLSLSTGELYQSANRKQSHPAIMHQQPPPQFHVSTEAPIWPNGCQPQLMQQQQLLARNGHSPESQMGPAASEISGLIGLQVNVDEHSSQLEVSILSAINIQRNLSLSYLVKVKILPESNRFKSCKTQPSYDMNWKETFIYQNFPVQQIQSMALDISLWVNEETSLLSAQLAQPVCETLVPIQSARERNTDFWPLRPPLSSPQGRRKSLNDLFGKNQFQASSHQDNFVASAGSGQWPMGQQHPLPTATTNGGQHQPRGWHPQQAHGSPRNTNYTRRASDEATGASITTSGQQRQKLQPSLGPRNAASGRRSISAMSVDASGARLQRQPQRPVNNTTASGVTRRDSGQGSASGLRSSGPNPVDQKGERRRSSTSSSSVVAGGQHYQPQQPRTGSRGGAPFGRYQREGSIGNSGLDLPMGSPIGSTATTASGESAGGFNSRRGSSTSGNEQRRGSLAMQTLRKLKRTMSLTKSQDPNLDPDLEAEDQSRRSSYATSDSSCDPCDEDLALSRRLVPHKLSFGRLKLSFIVTKGQLEVGVIRALGLQCVEDSLGVYVKMFLKGKNRSSKRKTRMSSLTEAPYFRQTISYDASLMDNKMLNISVWQKLQGLKGKQAIGFTEVQLNELNLEQLRTSWYNLRSMDLARGSGLDEM